MKPQDKTDQTPQANLDNNNFFSKFKRFKIKFRFKSVFTRLFVMYLSILMISFVMIATVLSGALESYYMNEKVAIMKTQAKKIANQYAIAYYTGVIDADKLGNQIRTLNEYIKAKIWIIGNDGKIIASTYEVHDYSSLKDNEKIKLLLEGNDVVVENVFNNMLKEPTLTVGCPVIAYERVKGAVLIHTPILEVKNSISNVYRIFLICLLISAFIAFILVYLTSKRITKPLKDINDAAKVIANGDFNKRITITTSDEIGELGKSFNDMAEGLNRLEEYRSNFIANISHDLRSPTTSIQGFLNAILDGTIPTEKQEKYLKIALDETKRLTKLTNDILELTKMENQITVLTKENFDINEMIRNILLSFEARIVEKDIKLKVIFIKESSWVYADAQKIERVIHNLLDNAVKFTPESGIIIIETSYQDDKIFISISDTGIGMDEEELKHIFERFYKADSSRGKDKKGTGLGLSIVREIIKAHNESITVNSKKDIGTKFTFCLQLSEEIN